MCNTFYACLEDRNNIEAIIKFFNDWSYSDIQDLCMSLMEFQGG